MGTNVLRILFFLYFLPLSCAIVGNPMDPDLYHTGILFKKEKWCSFRAGYMADWVYNQDFEDEFKLDDSSYTQTSMKLSTYAALLTLNIKNRLDINAIVGSSRMQIDQEIFTKRALGWGIGAKLILLKFKDLYFGGDAKYFETNQKPKYFIVEGSPYNIVSIYRLKYHELQTALGFAYKAWAFAPYLNATYLITKIEPEPAQALVRLPDQNDLADVESKSIINSKKWGLALGLTLVDSKMASLSLEWRALNQNSIDINGEIRF